MANKAPAVLLPEEDHHATFGIYSRWRTRMTQSQGVPYKDMDWSLITEAQMRQLAADMFDSAGVPNIVRDKYWELFDLFLNGLRSQP